LKFLFFKNIKKKKVPLAPQCCWLTRAEEVAGGSRISVTGGNL
jgi:hypothetical protein